MLDDGTVTVTHVQEVDLHHDRSQGIDICRL
jgi:hypothetical protein